MLLLPARSPSEVRLGSLSTSSWTRVPVLTTYLLCRTAPALQEVFSLTAGSFVTPAMLGGTNAQMLGNLIDQQITAVYDWPFGATIASVLVAIVVTVNLLSMRLLDGKRRATA